jgi:pyridoxamine 5'-phosphate oxidase
VRRDEVDADPLRQFAAWYPGDDAVALATATPDGAPSARMVLLKGFDERGFVFYTGYDSRKGRELEANPRAALLFYWSAPGRQVRIEGQVVRVTAEESDAYWASRPLGSRLSAAASEQSAPVESREVLERRVAELDGEPPRPERWGGYRLAPEAYEFWQHREDRLHDRFRYERAGEAWRVERLQP